MDGENGNRRTREQGIEFGTLTQRLDEYTYPVSSSDLVEADGDHELELSNGTQRLETLFEPLQDERFESAKAFAKPSST